MFFFLGGGCSSTVMVQQLFHKKLAVLVKHGFQQILFNILNGGGVWLKVFEQCDDQPESFKRVPSCEEISSLQIVCTDCVYSIQW